MLRTMSTSSARFLMFAGIIVLAGRIDALAQNTKEKDVWTKYTYPKYEHAGPVSKAGDMHSLLITTPDDFDKVIAWYAQVTDKSLEKTEPGSLSTTSNGISIQNICSPHLHFGPARQSLLVHIDGHPNEGREFDPYRDVVPHKVAGARSAAEQGRCT